MKNNLFSEVKFEKKPSGAFIVEGKEVAHTLQCCHCGCHYISIKGSGKIRGFCIRCMKVTCGSKLCDICIPQEEQLNKMDGG